MTESGTTAAQEITTDVVVLGGGLAGLSMAAALATAGVPVVCIDRDSPDRQAGDDFDIRTTAVAYASMKVLEGAGVWKHMEPDAGPILDIRVADQFSPLFVHYDHTELTWDGKSQPFGWILDNKDMRRALFARAKELPGLHHLAPAQAVSIERTRAGATVTLADGRVVKARLVVGADGRRSLARESAGIKLRTWAYDQTAIICTIRHSEPHNGVAVEHFLPNGPFAVLPMTGNRSSIVWSEKRSLVDMYLKLPEDQFIDELTRRSGGYLGDIELVTRRDAWPLSVLLAERFIAERVALIGEAAHAIHPIAGQGLNLGLRDVAALAEVIVDAHRLGLDVGSPEVLARFQRWRRFDTVLLAVVCDGLVHLFSNNIPPIKLARDVGMAVVNRLPPLKRFFMRHAMGVVGELPRMIKGVPL
ncbi:2-octaprenyl-6-methoxyphenol hydroxylase /2-octaprenyl-3-methyl-6-methoxy-1,4-benzoquinol hydroxylase [Azospirillum brasilense]|uniref:2-octaprenyl-6-methoxyphenol hydroxylase /2-octaprenyl-3-methyl-6-methoxy-1,4-benzoquinol hydroxylase n=1 Tax=Azospirillum brasilense TaxID=192 RepID=A0A560B9N5_AZOBR|nr:UbiH/UbiF/VisC/COQ6 family ubiquinone biosynthesis hydroxylase [Azospirillum brasilense]TWA69209.1 2-octaprenyl-6-methoxyphenol hydroxylase /2-octaprenyl-3-methyl-6-methoxy-1,4-benzoquinol hydroxylase [Azospirillum brasilense]